MGVKAMFKMSDIENYIDSKFEKWETDALKTLSRLGEMAVNEAREHKKYKDQTGNLKSSIGYIILRKGVAVSDYFPGEESIGKNEAKKIADEVARDYSNGWVLIVVAGMNYAVYVESMGLNVLTTSEQLVEREALKLLKQI